eukprot:389829-Rhodomonas_salina.1
MGHIGTGYPDGCDSTTCLAQPHNGLLARAANLNGVILKFLKLVRIAGKNLNHKQIASTRVTCKCHCHSVSRIWSESDLSAHVTAR